MIRCVEASGSSQGLARVLERAGETGPLSELTDMSVGSSYQRFRALLEAAGDELGVSALRDAGRYMLERFSPPRRYHMLISLGAPEQVYAMAPSNLSSDSTVLQVESEKLGTNYWLLRQRLAEGFPPFPELCAFMAGAYSVGICVFDLEPAEVVEHGCQCEGQEACEFAIRWPEQDATDASARRGRLGQQVLRSHIDELQQAVANLVSGDDADVVLERIVGSVSSAVPAELHVLALNPLPWDIRRVYAGGRYTEGAEAVAGALLEGSLPGPPDYVTAEVASTRRRYGSICAVRPAGVFGRSERSLLEAYGRLAAAALDQASALTEARRDADTAMVLLDLSRSLAEATCMEDIAEKLVKAVGPVADCDRATLWLREAGTDTLRLAAAVGLTPEAEAEIRRVAWPAPATDSGSIRFYEPGDASVSANVRRVMGATGSAVAVGVPIIVDGRWEGRIAAGVTGHAGRLRSDPHVVERLEGLAAQAAVAIRNARLLEQARHQALHDPLTGLPNRALILEEAAHLLARARRSGMPAAVLFVDLDGFKEVNDTFGHSAGDRLLCDVAARLQAAMREGDVLGRLSGDEFVILMEPEPGGCDAHGAAERLLEALRAPFYLGVAGALPITVTASVGVFVGQADSPDGILRDADAALYLAKSRGKNCYATFEAGGQVA